MATRSRNLTRTTILPHGAAAFLHRRLAEIGGLTLALAGAALALALASFDTTDPSLNAATGYRVNNWLGVPGAGIADFLLQSIGLAAWIIAAVLIAWGWRLGTQRGLGRLWLRLTLLPVTLYLGAIAAAGIDAGTSWPLEAGIGGITGDLALGWLTGIAAGFAGQSLDADTVAATVAALGAAALIGMLGFSVNDWRRAGGGALWLGRRAALASAASGRAGLRAGTWTLDTARRGANVARRIEPSLWHRVEPSVAEDADTTPQLRSPVRPRDRMRDPAPRAGKTDIVAPKRRRAAPGRRAEAARQPSLDLGPVDGYQLPSLDLLDVIEGNGGAAANQESLGENARMLESVLEDFGVLGEVVKVRPGPVVTLYEFEPAPGIKSSRVIGLADDIARSMSAVSVRVSVIPGRSVMGIELPNMDRETVSLREILGTDIFEGSSAKLALALGKDISGAPVIADLSRMPHLLIAGTTGSGKSVAINTMILSLLYRLPPEQCRMVMIDPKMLELSVYDGIPHLLCPVVTDPKKAVVALRWTVREMEGRYRAMSNLGVRNIAGYNARLEQARRAGETLTRTVQTGFEPDTGEPVYEEQTLDMAALPYIVVVVDEMADLMLVAGKEVEASVQRIAQMARAAGIHLIMATQRPSVDVITGTIKANFPTRISFQVTSKIDSRTILGEGGAEQLLGQGDMLHMAGGGRLSRVHGPLVTDEEVERVVRFLKDRGDPEYIEEVTEEDTSPAFPGDPGAARDSGGEDALYDQAIALVCRERKASTSFVQRHLQIGYNRAARIIERMEAEGVISRANHVGKREVLARDIDDPTT